MYVKPSIASKELGVSVQTLRIWADEGKIKYIRGAGNGRLYDTSSITNKEKNQETKKYIYCRVSCSKQKEDLERQISFLKEKYPTHIVITEIASGINFKRKKLQRILDESIKGCVSELVVAHKDRLCRISWDHFHWLFTRLGVNIIIEDREEHSPESELADDLFSIIHVFSCRHYGQRRNYTSRGLSEEITEEKTEE
jgi:putative resolvase